jgi:Fe2+ transport system protein FeoA
MEKRNSKRREAPLTTLKAGESGIVTYIRSGHIRGRHRRHRHIIHGHEREWGFEKRLMDMGLTPGTRVTVVKSAPFHGPFEILVRGSRLALGRGMAERIFVEIEQE